MLNPKRSFYAFALILLPFLLASGSPDCALGATGCDGWCDDSCDDKEFWNDQECQLNWCVNDGFAYYICEDGIATSKDCPNGDCEEPHH